MRTTLPLLFVTTLLVACAAQPTTTISTTSSEPAMMQQGGTTSVQQSSSSIAWMNGPVAFGISFPRPQNYTFNGILPEKPNLKDGSSFAEESIVMRGEGSGDEAPFMQVMRSKDAAILRYLAGDYPLENVTINGIVWQKFHWEGMGDPFGYVVKKGDSYLVISFTGWTQPYAEEKVMKGVKLEK